LTLRWEPGFGEKPSGVAEGRKKSVLQGPRTVYMLDAVNEKLLPSWEEDLLHNGYKALLGIFQAITVHQDLF
jgi:hypothetical protein